MVESWLMVASWRRLKGLRSYEIVPADELHFRLRKRKIVKEKYTLVDCLPLKEPRLYRFCLILEECLLCRKAL
jgi:hypothetical protein